MARSTTPDGSSTSTGPLGRDAGHPVEQLNVGITSHFYVGESQELALDDFYPYYHRCL